MQLIVITSPDTVVQEAEKINALFEAGLEILHIRKPNFSKKEYIYLIKRIKEEYHPKIKIHEFFELTGKYNLLGVHLNARNPNYTGRKVVNISRSCHSIEELKIKTKYDYVFLSPIFDSISKEGYYAKYNNMILVNASKRRQINKKVIALGGIDRETLPIVKQYGFGGAAVLGSIWQEQPAAIRSYEGDSREQYRKNKYPKSSRFRPLNDDATDVVKNFLILKSLL